MPSILELVRSSGLIFTGTVLPRGTPTHSLAPASDNLTAVRVDRGLRVDPVLGDLNGKTITVAVRASESLAPGLKAVFFTNSWIHGNGIAVREVDHMDVGVADRVAQVVSELPKVHLQDRLLSAELVAEGEVVKTGPPTRTSLDRNDPYWARADLKIDRVLRGGSHQTAAVYFPTSTHPAWKSAPRFRAKQRGIFVLHAPSRDVPGEASVPADGLIALDPADFQPESQRRDVEKLLSGIQ